MPKWIHDRAAHIRAKNPSMSESMSWAIATQQAHATGESPRGYGTAKGKRTAKTKFPQPKKSYTRTADPKGIGASLVKREKTAMERSNMIISTELARLEGFQDELVKIARTGSLGRAARRVSEVLMGGKKTDVAHIVKEPGKIGKFFGRKAESISVPGVGARPGNMGFSGLKDKATRGEAALSWGARGALGGVAAVGGAKAIKKHRKTEKRQLGRAYVAGARDMFSRVRRG